ncbi:MAG: hypothetical protein U9R14_01350 [Patescibacteria group bacterium]|nr:hypothetical protein [Patescibacteria group bacterium]
MKKYMDNFQQTVNLREKGAGTRRSASLLEHIYDNEDSEEAKQELQKIKQPGAVRVNETFVKRLTLLLAVILIGAAIFWMFFYNKSGDLVDLDKEQGWYTIKLVNEEIYYGQVGDVSADPVVIQNVYYNYGQQKDEKKAMDETGSLRLVKRGQETHGPDGTMNIIRSQVLYLEPLREDSKVLKAILEYEQ